MFEDLVGDDQVESFLQRLVADVECWKICGPMRLPRPCITPLVTRDLQDVKVFRGEFVKPRLNLLLLDHTKPLDRLETDHLLDKRASARGPNQRAQRTMPGGSEILSGGFASRHFGIHWPASFETLADNADRSTGSNTSACRMNPRSVGCEESTVASPSSPSKRSPSI